MEQGAEKEGEKEWLLSKNEKDRRKKQWKAEEDGLKL